MLFSLWWCGGGFFVWLSHCRRASGVFPKSCTRTVAYSVSEEAHASRVISRNQNCWITAHGLIWHQVSSTVWVLSEQGERGGKGGNESEEERIGVWILIFCHSGFSIGGSR